MKNVIKKVIESKNYELSDMLKKIDTLWVQGSITEDVKYELSAMARNNASMQNSIDVLSKLEELDKRVKALEDAIETEAQMTNNASLFTDEKVKVVEVVNYDYDALMAEFQSIVSVLMEKDNNFYTPRITQIVDKYLGKGKKVSEATRDQAEFIFLIIAEMKEELL